METAVKGVGRKEGMRPPGLSFAMAVSPIGAHQAGNLRWPTLSPWRLRNAEPVGSSSFPRHPPGEAQVMQTQINS